MTMDAGRFFAFFCIRSEKVDKKGEKSANVTENEDKGKQGN